MLKLLKSSYADRIKVIYIDPPYNTGKDRLYSDKFAQKNGDYLHESGQVDANGNSFSVNKDSYGRFHSKWLSMMYPRLRIARDLLCENGMIFISINEKEVHRLRMLLDNVFGGENFLAMITWQGTHTIKNDSRHFSTNNEFILVYAKDIEKKYYKGI